MPLSFFVIVWLIVIAIQIIYLVAFLYAFHQNPVESAQAPHPVSVIVCAHDEERNLRELVPLLLAQDHFQFEVIVVEDRSNDGSYDYLLQATQEDPRLKMVRVECKPEFINGKKFGITLGIRAAQYEWLLFTDADCRPNNKQWISHMTSKCNDQTKFVLGYSPYRKQEGLLNSFIRFESLITGIQAIGLALLGRPYMGLGRNLAYKKSVFMEGKGFNNYVGVVGGDDDLFVNMHATKSNTQVCLGSDTITISEPKQTLAAFMEQKLRHLHAGRRYKYSDKMILGALMLSWLLTWFLVFPAMFFTTSLWIIMVAILFRGALLIWLVEHASRRLGSQFESWKTPFLDFIFPFYYLVTGLRALVVKRIRWKN